MHTILVVEDELDVCENVAEILRNNTYKVVTASNGIEAMKILETTIPDLIISDILMPGIDGSQLLEFVQNSKKLSHVPFIFLTAKTTSQDLREAMENGADDYLTKPFRAVDLLKTVEIRLRKKNRYKDQVNKIREDIAFSIQHEMRTPLTPILGYSDMMIEYAGTFTSDDIEKMGISIKESAKRLRYSVEKFILFSNVQYEMNHLNREEIKNCTENLNILIRIAAAREQGLRNTENKIFYQIDECRLDIEEKHFLICVNELLENAFKFSKPDSIIKITGRENNDNYTLFFENYDNWLTTEQIDNINIFNKQSDPSTRGSGLGLPIVKKIMDFYDGSLEIESEKEKYLRVIIQIPIADNSDKS